METRLEDAPHLSGRRSPGEEVPQAAAASRSHFAPASRSVGRPARLWKPKRIFFTRSAYAEVHGRRIAERLDGLALVYEVLKADRLPRLGDDDVRGTYRLAKDTLAIVNAPKGQFRLDPIPPSADFQFHLAKGCPAHCQYCYLAGSLPGAPITRAYANLEAILGNVAAYAERGTTVLKRRPADADRHPADLTFEASCYTDPLGLEHLTGSLSHAIEAFAKTPNARLRWVTKYDDVSPLIGLDHGRKTRCRISLNAETVARRLEGGTADLTARLHAMRRLATPRERGGGGYRVGATIAPIMPMPGWKEAYTDLLDRLAEALDFGEALSADGGDLTFELITHRFTPKSKDVLLGWYPATKLDLDETQRVEKRNKFGGVKYVYGREEMAELKGWFGEEIGARFGEGRVLYFT